MSSLKDIDIKILECNSNLVELEFIDNTSDLGVVVIELYHIKDGNRSYVDLEKLYFDSTINSDTLEFYLTNLDKPDKLGIELGRKGDYGIDKRTIDIEDSKDQEIVATQKEKRDTGSIDKDFSSESSSKDRDEDKVDKGFLDVLVDTTDELFEEYRQEYIRKYSEDVYKKEKSENKGEKQENSSYPSNKVSKEGGKISKESKVNEVNTDKNHHTKTGETKHKDKHEHQDEHERHNKQVGKVGKNDEGKSKSEWIIELSKKGYSPKEIAKELDTTQDYVYVVRSNNGLGEKGNKKQQIIELDRQGYSVEQIAGILDTSKSYIYKVKSKN